MMDTRRLRSYTAFESSRRIASGDLTHVALKSKEVLDRAGQAPILIFDDATGEPIEVDFRGTPVDVEERLADSTGGGESPALAPPEQEALRGPGRPRLGVVAREVTLLPRHWEWLNDQPGGASVALRKLVEEARRANESKDRIRRSQEAAYRFISIMAGNQPGFEEATRALFRANRERFDDLVESWLADVRDHARRLAADAFAEASSSPPSPQPASAPSTA